MPEQINTIIPTKDELNLREQEPEERLLGSQVNKLATRGQRLDFIEKAESDAYEEYDSVLVRKANKLLLNPMLEPMDKERITALVKDATHSLQLLGAVITSLENKLSAPSERAVVSNMIDIIEKLVLKDYKNSKEISGTEIYSQDIETMLINLGKALFPDGLPKEVEIIPHAQTLSGQGNIFILVDNRSGFPQVKYIKTEINSMIIKRDPNLLRELSRDFDFQYNNADTEFNIVRPNGTAHDANAINKVITLPNAVRAIVMNQVLDSRNLLDELSLANEDKHIFLKNAAQELASFLKLFLTMYSDPGTFPKDWGLEDSRAFSPEFKGVGFFPKTTNDLAPNIGIYDFTVLARNTSYVPTIEKNFYATFLHYCCQ